MKLEKNMRNTVSTVNTLTDSYLDKLDRISKLLGQFRNLFMFIPKRILQKVIPDFCNQIIRDVFVLYYRLILAM